MSTTIRLKNILVYFLVSVFLFNSSGYFLLYISSIHFVKKLVISQLSNDELNHEIILLSIGRKDIQNKKVTFQWVHSKEFRFNGKMYDIKKNFSDNDSLRFYCYYDDKENLLEELFNKFSKGEKESNKNRPNNFNFLTFIGLLFDSSSMLILFDGIYYSSILPFHFTSTIIDVLTPPPQDLLVS